jgi:hypothetical protein
VSSANSYVSADQWAFLVVRIVGPGIAGSFDKVLDGLKKKAEEDV